MLGSNTKDWKFYSFFIKFRNVGIKRHWFFGMDQVEVDVHFRGFCSRFAALLKCAAFGDLLEWLENVGMYNLMPVSKMKAEWLQSSGNLIQEVGCKLNLSLIFSAISKIRVMLETRNLESSIHYLESRNNFLELAAMVAWCKTQQVWLKIFVLLKSS